MARTSPEKLPNHTPARRRGRPLGSAPYREADEKLLARYADKAIHNTGLELAPFARAAGVSQPATIRRLQARWRGDRERFLKDAQNRFDARRPESPWQILVDLYEGLRRMSRMLSREVLDPLSASIQKAERRWNALGESPGSPSIRLTRANSNRLWPGSKTRCLRPARTRSTACWVTRLSRTCLARCGSTCWRS